MNRLGVALACAALVALTGCGGGSDKAATKATETTAIPGLLTTSQACAQVQMVNEKLHGPGKWAAPTYGKFGDETAGLADQSVPEISDALKAMSTQAIAVGAASDDDATNAANEWAADYQVVADICAHTDSPIGLLP